MDNDGRVVLIDEVDVIVEGNMVREGTMIEDLPVERPTVDVSTGDDASNNDE